VSVSRAAAQVRKAQIDMAMGRGRLMRRSTIRQWGAMIKSQFLP
jgi:hypothetical protein